MIQVGLYHDSVLSLLLLIIALETLSREMRSRYADYMLAADNLAMVSKSFEDLKEQSEVWKVALELKGKK